MTQHADDIDALLRQIGDDSSEFQSNYLEFDPAPLAHGSLPVPTTRDAGLPQAQPQAEPAAVMSAEPESYPAAAAAPTSLLSPGARMRSSGRTPLPLADLFARLGTLPAPLPPGAA